jgi:CRISPR-associated protein Cas1
MALTQVHRDICQGYNWVVDADIENYFDRVPHCKLMEELACWIGDEKVLHLIRIWLKSFSRSKIGLAQGSPISPLLANLYLTPIDRALAAKGVRMVRYADDFVLLCPKYGDAKKAMLLAENLLKERGLRLKKSKTRILKATKGFDFLGERIICPESKSGKPAPVAGRWLSSWIDI